MDPSDASGYMHNASFDPYTQNVIILLPDGVTPTLVQLDQISALQNVANTTCILYGIQMGISAIILLVLLLMTKPEKRRNVVFTLNIAASLLVFVRSVVQCVTIFGPHWNFYNWVLLYYPDGDKTQEYNAEVMAAEVLGFLVLVAIELSLLFQTFTVTNMLKSRFRTVINISCVLVAALPIAVRFSTMVLNAMWSIFQPAGVFPERLTIMARMLKVQNGCIIGSIMFFSLLFCAKLGQAIRKRRSIGLKQFGPIQVIFVMGCQTMFIPAIFGVLSYWILPSTPLNTMMMCVVATFLPLSSIWASTKTDGSNRNIAAPHQWRQHGSGPSTTGHSGRYYSEKNLLRSATMNTTLVDEGSRGESFSGVATKHLDPQMGHNATVGRDSIDVELAKLGQDIQVHRTYEVRTD